MGHIVAICTSPGKGTPKQCRNEATLIADHGLEGDAHAGSGHRQISILPVEAIDAFRRDGADVEHGDFGENLIIAGINGESLTVGDRLRSGEAVLELTQFGKECHGHCRIYEAMGDCIMPRHGIFASVAQGGVIRVGDTLDIIAAGKDNHGI